MVHIKEEGDNIYRPDRAIKKGELDAAVTLLNQPEPGVDITHRRIFLYRTLTQVAKRQQGCNCKALLTRLGMKRLARRINVCVTILHQGTTPLWLDPLKGQTNVSLLIHHVENTPDWVENVRDEVIYLGGAFQHDDEGRYTRACGGFCLNALRYMRVVQEQLIKAQNPLIEPKQIPQSLNAEQMVCAYVDHLSSLHSEDIEAAMRAERFNLLLGRCLAEEAHSLRSKSGRYWLPNSLRHDMSSTVTFSIR